MAALTIRHTCPDVAEVSKPGHLECQAWMRASKVRPRWMNQLSAGDDALGRGGSLVSFASGGGGSLSAVDGERHSDGPAEERSC